ncbi:serine dehydratase subunit alpha family protein [Candidatus Mcinerneyibacteriota bacterium]|nr:serine dehydratase subunit alpha family protein [Candidatus Mcinerneyibacteriota bacterium]
MGHSLASLLRQAYQFTSGCTEPAAIGLNAAIAGFYLSGALPESFEIEIDLLTYKNAYNAGIPNGEGEHGTVWAALYGYLTARPQLKLEIFNGVDNDIVLKAKSFLDNHEIRVKVLEKESLYIRTTIRAGSSEAVVETRGSHLNITESRLNGIAKPLPWRQEEEKEEKKSDPFYPDEVYFHEEYWIEMVEKLSRDLTLMAKLRKGMEINLKAASYGKRYDTSTDDFGVAGAVYARMHGDTIPVMSVSGSGNKGLISIIPPAQYGAKKGASQEEVEKSVLLSTLVTMLITYKFGSVSSICGGVYGAGTGAMAGLLYLDKSLDRFFDAFRNYISSICGIFCDGAKGSCALKASAAVLMVRRSIDLVGKGFSVDAKDGFLGENFYGTLENLVRYNEHFARFDKSTVEILQSKS